MPAETRAAKVHELKADPGPFNDLASGRKRCEVRQNDRGYEVGDHLHLREHDRTFDRYTGRELTVEVTHIQRGYGLPEGLVVLSVVPAWPPTPELETAHG